MATFRTRARALDMLGRQQIAGIPTAIAELFKNAHDAYADRVEVDYFRSDKLFLLRDDGLGMTQQDFESRWLTLGTESKVEAGPGSLPQVRDFDKPLRPVLGEKGIGRLAVAVVGSQMLVLSRPKRQEGESEIVAAFIHWGLFESPGVDLDQIEVPVRAFPGGTLPTQADVLSMVEAVSKNVGRLEREELISNERAEELRNNLSSFGVDPTEYDGCFNGPRLTGEGHGTHFYIKPASSLLESDIKGEEGSDTAPPLIKLLIGFSNTMTPDEASPIIKTSFRDHRKQGSFTDLIREGSFFTPEEFDMADHEVSGIFDEYGTFSGDVTIYGQKTFKHAISWPSGHGKATRCGPFRIDFAYVQGRQIDTRMIPEDYAHLTEKLDLLGGLYLYRDGIRILPYGDTDYDWLGIEKRRTYGAGYYFFSYRRMFGTIKISREDNSALSEKAGREGFRENLAYRQFRSILQNFFIQLAADFFRSSGTRSEFFRERRAEFERAEKVRREREKRAKSERKAFSDRLERVLKRIQKGEPQQTVDAILRRAARATKAASKTHPAERAAEAVIEAEVAARHEISDLRDTLRVERPRGFGLTRELRRDWEAYQGELQGLEERVLVPAFERLNRIVGDNVRRAHSAIEKRRRAEAVVKAAAATARETIQGETQVTQRTLQETSNRLRAAVRNIETAIDQATTDAIKRITNGSASESNFADDDVVEVLEREINDLVWRERAGLADLREQLRNIAGDGTFTEATTTPLETLAVLEEELLAFRERSEEDAELTQLGMAVGIINHEFNQMVASVRRNVRRLRPWADTNPDLKPLYRELRTAFEHLDGYLMLLAPLQRRLYRRAIPITGREIGKYLRELFAERLRRGNVQLEVTPAFQKHRVIGFPSTFYPVFVNLMDNALYWLRDVQGPRVVRLDADGEAFLIRDTGPGIMPRDRDAIFEQGFTRKPGGSGLGLYISRNALSKAGYRIEVEPNEPEQGTTFRIEPAEQNS